MKKISVVVQSKDAQDAVAHLRRMGVLHVEHATQPKGSDISELGADISLVTAASSVLSGPEFVNRIPLENGRHVRDWKAAANHIVSLWKRIDQLGEYSRSLISSIKEWASWGDFDPERMKQLESGGIYVKLYEIPLNKINLLPDDLVVRKISVTRGVANCVVAGRKTIDIPFKEKTLPKMGPKAMRQRLEADAKTVNLIKTNITRHLRYRQTFARIKTALERELEFHKAWRGMGQAGELSYITGYAPLDKELVLKISAQKQGWGLLVSDPSPDDLVPTLVRNPKWVSIIEPLFKVIAVVPGYNELDISLWFLIFFSIFFGMLIGDAGTGSVFMILTFFAHKKFGKKMRDGSIFGLLYVLSGCAIAWGVLSGTFFGQAWLPEWVKPLIPALREDRSVQMLCFFLGALHMSLGHAWRAILKWPSLAALCDAGWAMILWGAYFVAGYLVLSVPMPAAAKWLLAAGSLLVVLFTDASKGILRGIPGGFGNLLLNIMNNLTDVVSYVRLFAVGLASLAVADSFNKIALDIGFGSFGTSIVTGAILMFGQLLNVVLGPLSVLVHGIRLNVLEFCNHVDIKWTGFSYDPLREDAGR